MAVKVFDQPDTGLHDVSTEIIRSYGDMRYELNKLSLLKHPYIVRFIGVLTNPHSFVLEWAPEKSLEHIRVTHAQYESPVCAAALFQTLVQVRLFMHDPPPPHCKPNIVTPPTLSGDECAGVPPQQGGYSPSRPSLQQHPRVPIP